MDRHKSIRFSDLQINQKLKPYFQFFYLMGHSSHSLHEVSSNKSIRYRSFVNQLPAFLWILWTISLLILGIKFHIDYNERTQFQNLLISILFMILESSVSITIYLQCFFKQSMLKSIIEHFQFLVNYFECKFQFQISLSQYMRETRRDFLKIASLFIVGITVYGLTKILLVKRKDGMLSFYIDAMQISVIIAPMHCILYINLTKYMMSKLNELIMQNHDCNQINVNSKQFVRLYRRQFCDENRRILIKRMKLIYYRLWRITQLISDFFGWIIAAIVIQNFVFVTFGFYWGYVILINKKNSMGFGFAMIGPIVGIITPAFTTAMLVNSAQKLYQQVNYNQNVLPC